MTKVTCDKCGREIHVPLERAYKPSFKDLNIDDYDLCFTCYDKWQIDKQQLLDKIRKLEEEIIEIEINSVREYFNIPEEELPEAQELLEEEDSQDE